MEFKIKKDMVKKLFGTKFINLYDLQYAEGKHYYDASRHETEDITAVKTDEEFKKMLPDAVTCFVVLNTPDGKYLLLSYEYRYAVGRFMLSPPAGLIDREDRQRSGGSGYEGALKTAAIREIFEETGLTVKESDIIKVVNPCVFSTPGMTDESNALIYVEIKVNDLKQLSQAGAEGSELFDGFELLDRKAAQTVLEEGRDKNGFCYPAYTWMALSYFLSHQA